MSCWVDLHLIRRVLEQAAILEAIADAQFERVEFLRQRHDHAATDLLTMALDDADGVGGILVANRNAGFPERTQAELEEPRRRA